MISDFLILLKDILLFSGLFMFAMGTFFFFVPAMLIRWNAYGNKLLRDKGEHSAFRRLIIPDYAIFVNHRITGGIMWGVSSLFFTIYNLYG